MKNRNIRFVKSSLIALSLAAAALSAAQDNWTGGSSTDWNDGGNWSFGSAPFSTDDATVITAPFPILINGSESAHAHNLTLQDSYLTVGGSLNATGDISILSSSGGTNLEVGGLGAVANLGSSTSTINVSFSGGFAPSITATSAGTLNFISNNFTSDSASNFSVATSNASMSFTGATSIAFGSSMGNFGGQLSYDSANLQFTSGSSLTSWGGTVLLNELAVPGATTLNNGTLTFSGANLYEAGDFDTEWFLNTANSSLYFGYDSLGNPSTPITFTNGLSTALFANDILKINGNVENSGLFQMGDYTNSGGSVTITGSVHNTGSQASMSFENGNATTIGGNFSGDNSGGAEVWGSSIVHINGNINLETAGRFFVQDLQVWNGSSWVDYGGGTATADQLNVTDGWVNIGQESSLTVNSATISAGPLGYVDQELEVQQGGQLDVATGDLAFSGYAYSTNFGTTTIDHGALTLQDRAQYANYGTLNVLHGGVSNSAYFATLYSGQSQIYGGFDNYGTSWNSVVYNANGGSLTIYNSDLTNRQKASIYTTRGGSIAVQDGNVWNRNSATFDVHDAGSQATVVNGNFTNQDSAVTNIWNNGALRVTGANYVNAGSSQTNVSSNGLIQVLGGNFINQDAALLNVGTNGSVVVTGGDFNNTGGAVYVGSPTDSTGSITVSGDYNQTGALTYTKVYGSLTATNINDLAGDMGGPGSFIGTLNVGGTGIFNVGDPQTSHVLGDFNLDPGGTLILNIDGPGGVGVGNDLLDVTGHLHLAGNLEIMIGPGYSLSGVYDLFQYGSFDGSFSSVEEILANGQVVPLGGTLNLGSNGGTLNAVPEPGSLAILGLGFLGFLRRKKK